MQEVKMFSTGFPQEVVARYREGEKDHPLVAAIFCINVKDNKFF